jgi:putative glutamine amidotransferase
MKRVAITYGSLPKMPPYAAAVRHTGAEPVLVSAADGIRSLDGFAGLLLSGGGDADPRRYGQEPDRRTHQPNFARDEMELRLLREALDRDLPVLAICRGMQMLNIAHPGGTLWQHIEGHEQRSDDASAPAHPVAVEPGTRLAAIAAALELQVNSRHHQAVSKPGANLVVSATAPDGIVEALERPDRRFAIAVQWHPEDQLRFAPQLRLFEAFAVAL